MTKPQIDIIHTSPHSIRIEGFNGKEWRKTGEITLSPGSVTTVIFDLDDDTKKIARSFFHEVPTTPSREEEQ